MEEYCCSSTVRNHGQANFILPITKVLSCNKMDCCSSCDLCLSLNKTVNYNQGQAALRAKFGSPMHWIGAYAAAASLICSMALAADVFQGFRHKKLWFPCKFFTLNAASLTLLAVALKLPGDLSSEMPGQADQLAKLSSSVLMCTVMSSFMLSLASMGEKEIFVNIFALGIIIVALVVDVCVQLVSGVIVLRLAVEHAIVMLCMSALFVVLCFTALAVPATKNYLELEYCIIHRDALNEQTEENGQTTYEKLKKDVTKYRIMAETGNPQFVIAGFATCSASGLICIAAATLLVEAELRIFCTYPYQQSWSKQPYLESNSDYKCSTTFILVIQTIGVVIGTIAPTIRWLTAINYKFSMKASKKIHYEFETEHYWTQRLKEWKERPFPIHIRSLKCRRIVQKTKDCILNMIIGCQIMIVVAYKLVELVSIFLMMPFFSFWSYCKRLTRKIMSESIPANNISAPDIGLGAGLEMKRYVLRLQGEEKLPERMLKNICHDVARLIKRGEKRKPKYLKNLLSKSTGFSGVAKFDSEQVHLSSKEPPNCWTMPVVTLTSIALALPCTNPGGAEMLLHAAIEGLFYANLVEKSLDSKEILANVRNAAEVMWTEIEVYRKWQGKDLDKVSEGQNPKETLEILAETGKTIFTEFKNKMAGSLMEDPLNWPAKLIAANSMYRISITILLDYESSNPLNADLFEHISNMIADILTACLSNLPYLIKMKCNCSAIEEREKSVCDAAWLLGETAEILEVVQLKELPDLDPDQLAYIDEWRAVIKQEG